MLMQRSTRRGFTLVELLLAIVLFSIIATATVRIIVNQQRFYAGSADMMAMRGSLRDANVMLPTDLRGIASAGGDILAMSDSALDFRLPIGMGVVCSIAAGRLAFVIPPTTLASQSALTTYISTPTTGDFVYVYDDGATSLVSDDSWQQTTLAAAPAIGSCPTYTSSATEAATAITITVTNALNATVVPGAVVRFYRRAKYKFFQPTAGGAWYLGYYDCPGGVCGTLQTIAGPYLAYSTTASATGLRFIYRDSLGAVTATPANVARIDVVARAQTRNPIRMPGRPIDYYSDSTVISIGLRNRN